MSNLTASVIYETHPRAGVRSYLLKDAEAVYGGSLIGLDADGYAVKWSNAALQFLGMALEPATGNTSATPKTEVRVNTSGFTIKGAAVASVAQTNVGDYVYCSTDNAADLVLTPTLTAPPVGKVVRYVTTNTADVELFASSVGATSTKGITYLYHPLTSLATGLSTSAIDILTGFTPGFAFKILDWGFATTVAGTGSGASQTFNLEIGTTNVTGGSLVVTLASTSDIGEITAATAITAANIGTASDTISIEMAASGTVFTAGAGYFFIKMQNLDA